MAQKYLKLFYDFLNDIEALSMEERGRLLTAMLVYGGEGRLPEELLTGSERILFPVCRQRIDRDGTAYDDRVETNRANGARGGRPRKNPSVISETEKRQDKDKDKDEDKGKDKDKDEDKDNRGECVPRAGAGEPARPRLEGSLKDGDGEECRRDVGSADEGRESGGEAPGGDRGSPGGGSIRERGNPGGGKRTSTGAKGRERVSRDGDQGRPGGGSFRDQGHPGGGSFRDQGHLGGGNGHPSVDPEVRERAPTLEAVRQRCREDAPSVDPERFWNHYQAAGWRDAGQPTRDWRAKLRQWELDNRAGRFGGTPPARAAPQVNPALIYEQRETLPGDYDNLFIDLDHYGEG